MTAIDPYQLRDLRGHQSGSDATRLAIQQEHAELAALIEQARSGIDQATADHRTAIAVAKDVLAAAHEQAATTRDALQQHQASAITDGNLPTWAATLARLEDNTRAAAVVVDRAKQQLDQAEQAYQQARRREWQRRHNEADAAFQSAYAEQQERERALLKQLEELRHGSAAVIWPKRNAVIALDQVGKSL